MTRQTAATAFSGGRPLPILGFRHQKRDHFKNAAIIHQDDCLLNEEIGRSPKAQIGAASGSTKMPASKKLKQMAWRALNQLDRLMLSCPAPELLVVMLVLCLCLLFGNWAVEE